jgi:hypothetical protein
MEWCKLYARYPHDGAINAAGEQAELLFIRSMAYCAELDTKGFVPTYQLPRFGLSNAKRRASSLVEQELWTVVDGGWLLTNWEKLQAEVTSIEKRRNADRLRKSAQRKGRKSADRSAETSTGQSAESPHAPSLLSTGSNSSKSRDARIEISADEQARSAAQPTTQQLIGEWIDHCPQRPPKAVVGQVSKELARLATEGYDPDQLRRALAAWHAKGLHPATLPSVLNEVINATGRPTKATARAAGHLALIEQFAHNQPATRPAIGPA